MWWHAGCRAGKMRDATTPVAARLQREHKRRQHSFFWSFTPPMDLMEPQKRWGVITKAKSNEQPVCPPLVRAKDSFF